MKLLLANDASFYIHLQGQAEGTSYTIIYQDQQERNFENEIKIMLTDFEKSLSVYDSNSLISCFNRNEPIVPDDYLLDVVSIAKEVSRLTDGAFDISGEPLFRLWGFSSEQKKSPKDEDIQMVMQFVGMDKIEIEGQAIIKSHPQVVINANAIAKGYSADIVADFLESEGIENFLVEVGGEIRLKGKNPEDEMWSIGIDLPSDDGLQVGEQLSTSILLTDCAIATSGNYRQFYISEGNKIGHTIDPRTGYPTNNNLLSATVISDKAIVADAFATAFLVAGLQKSMEWVESYSFLNAVLIYNDGGMNKIWKKI